MLAVCAVFVFQGAWNDLLGPLIYLDSNNKFTLAIGLANMVTRTGTELESADGGEPDHDHPDGGGLLLRPG